MALQRTCKCWKLSSVTRIQAAQSVILNGLIPLFLRLFFTFFDGVINAYKAMNPTRLINFALCSFACITFSKYVALQPTPSYHIKIIMLSFGFCLAPSVTVGIGFGYYHKRSCLIHFFFSLMWF